MEAFKLGKSTDLSSSMLVTANGSYRVWREKFPSDKFKTARKPSIFCILEENGLHRQAMRMVSN
jgi:hypothetical protein